MKLLLNLLILLPLSLNATTYYVAPSGGSDSNPGTIGSPWATWQHAFVTPVAGDTVYFRGGTWYPQDYAVGNSIIYISVPTYGHDGTAENPICFFNYPEEVPILDCSQVDTAGHEYNTGIDMYYADYWYFKGLTVCNVFQTKINEVAKVACGIGPYLCSNLTFENCTVHDIGGRGFSLSSTVGYFGITSDTTRWINCDVYNCNDTRSVVPGNAGDGFKVDGEAGGEFYFYGCRIWHASDDGIDVSGPIFTIIDHCWSFHNGDKGTLEGGGFKFGANRGSGSYIEDGELILGTDIPGIRKIVRYSLAAFNPSPGFGDLEYVPYYRNRSRVYNNTSYKNGAGFSVGRNHLEMGYLDSTESIYNNNLAYGTTVIWNGIKPYDMMSSEYYQESNNTFDYADGGYNPHFLIATDVTVTDADFVAIDSTDGMDQLTGARKADGSLPDITFLTLASGSDLINAGVDMGIPYNGTSPDIGFYESGNYEPPLSSNNIISFTIAGQVSSSISTLNHTVTVHVPYGSTVTSYTPTISVSSGATISPESGQFRDFTNPVSYIVTAEDLTMQEWMATVIIDEETIPTTSTNNFLSSGNKFLVSSNGLFLATNGIGYVPPTPELLPDNDILTFTIPSQTGTSAISTVNHTVGVSMPYGTDVTGLTPTITVSEGAIITPQSGVEQDFTDTVDYTVISESNITEQWEATVTVPDAPPSEDNIIADHNAVAAFDNIPAEYITEIKKMRLVYAGESHAIGVINGFGELRVLDPTYFAYNTGTPPTTYTPDYLRLSGYSWGDYDNASGWIGSYGEEDWFANTTSLSRTKAGITYANHNGFDLSVLCFGWCWDATAGAASSGIDPVTGNHWYGWSEHSPSGDKAWGIDDADNAVTGNTMNMDSYLEATQSYIDYCSDSIPTKVVFTTGPVDRGLNQNDESMYQGYLKNEHIRDYVDAHSGLYLFDYADILCYDNGGSTPTTDTWNGNTFPEITPTNLGAADVGHIGYTGRIRLAKAMWWMLARMAGWDGN